MLDIMRHRSLLLIATMFANSAAWCEPAAIDHQSPIVRQLTNVTPEAAERLIRQLEGAQRRMKTGQPPGFTISTISVDTTEPHGATPHDVFLNMPFRAVWLVQRTSKGNPMWESYHLAYTPHPRVRWIWDIEVNVGYKDDIQSVVMDYRVPAPS